MSELSEVKPSRRRDPKLGIKSSLRKPKREFALLALLFLANSREIKIHPTELDPTTNKLRIRHDQIKGILKLFRGNDINDQDRLSKLENAIQKSAITTSQIESLIVAFELFMPLAEVKFSDPSVPLSKERTGGRRYPKSLRFSSGILSLCGGTKVHGTDTLTVFENWINDVAPPESTLEQEKEIKRRIFSLVAKTQFKLDSTQASGGDTTYFNTLGLYESVLQDGAVSIGGPEKKGALRILASALKNHLLPGLVLQGNEVTLNVDPNSPGVFSKEEVEFLVAFEKKYQELTNVEDITSDRLKPREDSPNETSMGPRNIIFYGVPGSGKSHVIDKEFLRPEDYSERVVFHPDYLYSNFIGQILPSIDGDLVKYDFKPGPFTRILKEAFDNPERRHILIIEEINRGNAAAIFGDIFQLLDRDSDNSSRYSIQNADIATYVFGTGDSVVSLPSNLFLLATMNTTDQSVYTLDTAFQRRWSMRMIRNDIKRVPYADQPILDTSVTWRRFNEVINSHILSSNEGMTSSEDKRLGAFFISEEEIIDDPMTERASAFAEKVLKYLWDDAFKFNRTAVFRNAGQRTLEDLVSEFRSTRADARWKSVLRDSVVEDLLISDINSHMISKYEESKNDSETPDKVANSDSEN